MNKEIKQILKSMKIILEHSFKNTLIKHKFKINFIQLNYVDVYLTLILKSFLFKIMSMF